MNKGKSHEFNDARGPSKGRRLERQLVSNCIDGMTMS